MLYEDKVTIICMELQCKAAVCEKVAVTIICMELQCKAALCEKVAVF
jgi:hypothetical protein